MATLYHYPLCPHSRFIRLVLSEFGMEAELVEERVWERRREFIELNTAGTTPVFQEQNGLAVPGAGPIAEYLDETRGLALSDRRLLPEGPGERVEVRRLLDWFNIKFNEETGTADYRARYDETGVITDWDDLMIVVRECDHGRGFANSAWLDILQGDQHGTE